MTLFGIDTSGATVDWPKVKAAGISFAIVKATEGNGFVQSTLPANLKGMRALGSGFVPGAYHFLISEKYVSGADQCDYFLAHVGDVSNMIVALDVEVEKNLTYQPGLVAAQQFVQRFWDRVPGHPILIYSGRWYWGSRTYMGNPNGTYLTKLLWDSKYVTVRGTPQQIYASVPASWWTPGYGGWTTSTLLQFTAMPTVAGVSGAVDASAFRGTLDQLKQQLVIGGQPLPDTSGGDVVIIQENFDSPRPVGIARGVTGLAGYALNTTTGALTQSIPPQNFPDGSSCHAGRRYTFGGKSYLFIVDGVYKLAVIPEGGGVTLGPAPATDCTAQVKAATDPLNAKVASLTGELSDANAKVTALQQDIFAKDTYIGNYPKG